MADNEFRIGEVPPGSARLVGDVAVFNVDGSYCATQSKCTHKQGPRGLARRIHRGLPVAWFTIQRVYGRRFARPGQGST
jgi:hypothetical protein